MTSSSDPPMANGVHSPPLVQHATNGAQDHFTRHERLIDWVLENNGYLHPDVEIAYSSSKGFHMLVGAGKTAKPHTRVTSCPIACSLSVLNVLDITPFSNHGTQFPREFLDNNVHRPELLQAFFLMEQAVLGHKSWWASYIQTLPTVADINDLQFESEDDRKWLQGTNLASGWADLTLKWKGLYDKGLKELTASNWPHAIDASFTWELYRWAATIFGSRGFSSIVLSDTPPAERARLGGRYGISEAPYVKDLFTERFSVLLPLLDILNHKPMASVEWQPRAEFVGLQVQESFEAGEELCNNYGPRDNESLLLSYGFTIPNNPFDHVLLSIKPPPGTLLDHTRSWTPPDPRSSVDRRPYLLDINHHRCKSASSLEASVFGFDLLDTVSVLLANERESGSMVNWRQTIMSFGIASPHMFDDFRNLLAVFGQLLIHCKTGILKLESTYPQGSPATSKQQHAKAYRDIQHGIYSAAGAVCKYVLLRAHMDRTSQDHSTLSVLEPHLKAADYEKLELLLARHPVITLAGELLSPESLLTMLPQIHQDSLRATLKSLAERFIRQASAENRAAAYTQSHFAVLIAAAYHFHTHGKTLPKHLALWIEKIAAWYPPDDENWSYVPVPGPWEPGEDPPQGLMDLLDARDGCVKEDLQDGAGEERGVGGQWLGRPALCWGWNVMHEETVQVPLEILQFAGTDVVHGEGGAMRYLLYVDAPQAGT